MLNNCLVSFFTGGIILSSITFCTKHYKFNEKTCSLIWSAPILLILTILLLYISKTPLIKIEKFVFLSIPYLFLTIIWQALFVVLLRYKVHIISSLIISLFLWIIIAIYFYKIDFHNLIY